MNRKKILIFTLIFASISVIPANLTKAEEIKSTIIYQNALGVTTNQLKPYILNEKELHTVFVNFSKDIEKLQLNTGYYVFDNKKYGLDDSEVYVMISLGKRPTTGYGINLLSAEDIEGTSKITIQEIKPLPNAMVGEAITHPYIILRYSKGTSNVKVVAEDGAELSALVNPLETEDTEWNDLKPWWDVSADKEWLITFKKNITTTMISDNMIYVRDSNGNKVPVELITGTDNKTVQVVPVEKYSEGQTYYLFISNKVNLPKDSSDNKKGYRMTFSIESEVTVGDPVTQEANSCVISSRNENAPIFDAATNLQVGILSQGFSIDLTDINDGKAYFSLPITDGKITEKKYYVPMQYLSKAYKEPFVVPMIISTDMIKIKQNASIYSIENGVKQLLMKTTQAIGPMHYIMKTDNGYQFVFANNVVYVQPDDVEIIKE
jgi:hypothetical protein